MAIHKIGSAGLPVEQESSFLGNAANSIARLPAVALKGLGDISNAFTNELAQASPGFKQVAHNFKPLVTTEQINKSDFLKPKNAIDNIADLFVGDLPIIWATGGLGGGVRQVGKTFATHAASGAAVHTTKELGGGPLAQFIAGLSPFAFRQLTQKGLLPKNLREFGEKLREESYDQAKKQGNIKIAVPEYKDALTKIEKSAYELSKGPERTRILGRVRSIRHDIDKNGKAFINKIGERKQEFHKYGYEYSYPEIEQQYYRDIAKAQRETLSKISEEVPAFGKHFKIAEDLHIGLKAKSALTKVFEHNADVKNYLKLSGPLKMVTKIITGVASKGLKRGSWAYDLIKNSSTIQDRIIELSKEAVNGNRGEFFSTLQKLKFDVDKEIKKDGNIQGNVRHISKKG